MKRLIASAVQAAVLVHGGQDVAWFADGSVLPLEHVTRVSTMLQRSAPGYSPATHRELVVTPPAFPKPAAPVPRQRLMDEWHKQAESGVERRRPGPLSSVGPSQRSAQWDAPIGDGDTSEGEPASLPGRYETPRSEIGLQLAATTVLAAKKTETDVVVGAEVGDQKLHVVASAQTLNSSEATSVSSRDPSHSPQARVAIPGGPEAAEDAGPRGVIRGREQFSTSVGGPSAQRIKSPDGWRAPRSSSTGRRGFVVSTIIPASSGEGDTGLGVKVTPKRSVR
jgi:hypothetical protein